MKKSVNKHECEYSSEDRPYSHWTISQHDNYLQLCVNGEYCCNVKICPFCGFNVNEIKDL